LRTARIAVPDLVSNSYFPAIATIALDFLNRDGLDVRHQLIVPNDKVHCWAICALAPQDLTARDVV
jgi:hypothetical protein